MAKIREASDEVIKFVNDIAQLSNIKDVTIKTLFDDSLKTFAKVAKGNGVVEYLTDATPVLVVYVNEQMFDAFDDRQRRMLLENELSGVIIDYEHDKMNVKKPDMMISSETWRVYGSELLNAYMAALMYGKQENAEDDGSNE